MKRRNFLKTAGSASALLTLGGARKLAGEAGPACGTVGHLLTTLS